MWVFIQPGLRAFMFRVWKEERLDKWLTSMGVTDMKRGGKRDIKPYPELWLETTLTLEFSRETVIYI